MSPEPAVTVRPVTVADVPAVVALVRAVLAEFGIPFGVGSETDKQLDDLPEVYTDAGGAFWVACTDAGNVVGTAGVFPVAADTFELRKMYVAPAGRGTGIGAALLARAITFCRESGARALALDTTEAMDRAIAFYERSGFVRDDAQVRGARCSRGYRLDLV